MSTPQDTEAKRGENSEENNAEDSEEDSEESNDKDLVSVFVQVGRSELPVYAPRNSTIAQLKEFVQDTFWLIDGLTVPGPSAGCTYRTEQGESVSDTQTLTDFTEEPHCLCSPRNKKETNWLYHKGAKTEKEPYIKIIAVHSINTEFPLTSPRNDLTQINVHSTHST